MNANADADARRDRFAAIPALDRLLRRDDAAALVERFGRALVVAELRADFGALRATLRADANAAVPADAALIAGLGARLDGLNAPSLRPVYNLTGTVLHTNLGRAPLPPAALAAVAAVAAGASTLEYDLDAAARGDRDAHIEDWLCRLCGCEAATVVNNNAAALLLILNALALDREVPVSRGELVEIGGSFRLPDIMRSAGCRLVEVGTTNRTHAADFERAVNDRTALLLRVHTSNYRIEGFTAAVAAPELAAIAHRRGIPLVDDLGSGCLIDLRSIGLAPEPTPAEALRSGADLVCFSGDKLLGGPQCGLIAGRRDLVEKIKRSPMKRALRCDKMTLAALQTLLPLYADAAKALREVPALRLLGRDREQIRAAAERLLPALNRHRTALGFEVDVADCASQIGSGALPVAQLPSAALRLRVAAGAPATISLKTLAAAFRALPVPVIGRLHDDALWFDLRCLEQTDEAGFSAQLDRLRR